MLLLELTVGLKTKFVKNYNYKAKRYEQLLVNFLEETKFIMLI